jgi:hypothetical protein
MNRLYERLEEAGVEPSYVRDYVLPEWWDDEIAESGTGQLEGLGYISKFLGINVRALRDSEASLQAPDVAGARFKLRSDVDHEDVTWAQSLCVRAAEIAAHATPTPYRSLDSTSAQDIRTQILDADAPWIGLKHLLRFCWDSGIPVLHVPEVPGRKMDGIALQADGRPAIVISKNHRHDAWLLFILAHELGHIANGHLEGQEVWIDEEYDPNPTGSHEQEANQFAVETVTGNPHTHFNLNYYVAASELAQRAEATGNQLNVDPGAVVLNFAFHDDGGPWPLANATLNELYPDAEATEVFRHAILNRIDWTALPDESAAFLARVTGLPRIPQPELSAY